MKAKGFTIIELIIVLVIISIITYLSISRPNDSPELGAQAQKMASDIRYIQFLAMSRHEMLKVNFSSSNYSMTESDGTTAVILPTTNTNSASFETGTTASASASEVYFDFLGIPYATTTTALASNVTITLTATDGNTKTLTLSPETGYVAIT